MKLQPKTLSIAEILAEDVPLNVVRAIKDNAEPKYTDTAFNDHIYNIDDVIADIEREAEGDETLVGTVSELRVMEDLLQKANCVYFRIIFQGS